MFLLLQLYSFVGESRETASFLDNHIMHRSSISGSGFSTNLAIVTLAL